MKKKAIILISLLAVLSFNACSKAASGITETPAITNPDNGGGTGDTGGNTAGLITTEWKNWEDGERVTTSIVDGVLIADITNPGSQTYDPKVFRALTLTNGKTYTVSFTAKAETARTINVNIGKQLTASPWFDDVMGSIKPIALTTEMKEYTFEFTASHASAPESDIIFELGNGATTKVHIKDLKVVEKTSTGGGTTPPVVIEPTTGTGLLKYNDFTFHTSTGSTHSIDSNGIMTYTVTTLGGQWDNQILNEVPIAAEGNYLVKFTASSTVDRDLLFKVDKIGCAGTSEDKVIRLTSTPTEYSINVTNVLGIVPDAAKLKVVIALGDLDGSSGISVPSTVTLKDFYLDKQ